MRLQCVFDGAINTTYDIAIGATFTDCFSDELDSGSICISHIEENKRLAFLECYQYVYIHDLDSEWSKYALINTYNETIQNVYDINYEYTISLMSETKILEKIQLPNRVITHSLVSGQKKIREYLYEYCSLYVPKIKFSDDNEKWYYKYIFDFSDLQDTTSDIYNKFDILCPDMSFSQPTLRQALTSMMEVIGCLPTIKNRKLSYLDLRAEPTAFSVSNVNYITRSMASDSYVNSLMNMGTDILDTKNQIISEVLGFRDKENVYLKQKENLVLETKKPIYNIIQAILCCYTKTHLIIRNVAGSAIKLYVYFDNDSTTVRFVNETALTNAKIIFFQQNSIGKLVSIKEITYDTLEIGDRGITKPTGATGAILQGYYDTNKLAYCNSYISNTNAGTGDSGNSELNIYNHYSFYKKDITELFVEESKRQALDTDFTHIPASPTSVSEIAQYFYTTIGYTIGSKKISGFSKTYDQTNGFYTIGLTYIEAIWNALMGFDSWGDYATKEKTKEFYLLPLDYQIEQVEAPEVYGVDNINSYFSNFFFNIKYQPQNSLNIKYFKSKKDIEFPIEQLDTQEASIPSFDDMSLKEQQKVDRLGNDTYQIAQRITNMNDLNALNTLYNNDKIIYKRTYSIYNDFIKVAYTASKDYVIKNYFTSIQTKYRAYEYVDYTKSVIRKENNTFFVLIDNYYINGDDKVWFGSVQLSNSSKEKSLFLTGAIRKNDTKDNLVYFMYSDDTTNSMASYKNEISSIVSSNSLVFNFEDFDNSSAGTYIDVITPQNGGLPQKWLMFSTDYYTNRVVGLVGNVAFVSENDQSDNQNYIIEEISKVHKEPIVPTTVYDRGYNDIVSIFLVDDNTYSNQLYTTEYKDLDEIMNRTIQFTYYTNSNFIKWTTHFIELCELYDYETLNRNNYLMGCSNSEYESFSDRKQYTYGHNEYLSVYSEWLELNTYNKDLPYLLVKWSIIPAATTHFRVVNQTGYNAAGSVYEFTNVIAFARPYTEVDGVKTYQTTDEKYYISLNDTKSEKVYTIDTTTGLYHKNFIVQTNTMSRLTTLDNSQFRNELVYFSEISVSIEDFRVDNVYFSTEVESV